MIGSSIRRGKAEVFRVASLSLFNLFMLPFLFLFVWNEVISECISVVRSMEYIEAFIVFWSFHFGVKYYKRFVV